MAEPPAESSRPDLPDNPPADPPPAGPPDGEGAAEAPVPPPKKKKRRFLWLKIVVAVVVLLALLVGFAPMILSTSPGKSFVVGLINHRINGRLTVADWSIGWTSGIDVKGVQLYDRQNAEVLSLREFKSPLSLLSAIGGNYDLGGTKIEGLNFVRCVIDENGRVNLLDLLKSPSPSRPPAPESKAAGRLPNIKGHLIADFRGTFELRSPDIQKTIYLEPSRAVFDIADINSPIKNDIEIVYKSDLDGRSGTVTLAGDLAAIRNNHVSTKDLTAHQVLTVKQADLAALDPLLKIARLNLQAAGIAEGNLKIDVTDADQYTAAGAIHVGGLSVSGPLLKGDTFKTQTLDIPVDASSSIVDGEPWLKVVSTGLKFDQGSVLLNIDAPRRSLMALSDALSTDLAATGTRPSIHPTVIAGGGSASLDIHLQVAQLLNQMPHLAMLLPQTHLDGGELTHRSTLSLASAQPALSSRTELAGVTGTRDGRAIRLEPVQLDLAATPLSQGGLHLQDLKLALQSGFAQFNAGGPTLSQIQSAGTVDLRKLQEQLGQFIDLRQWFKSDQPVQLAGMGKIEIDTQGDPAQANVPIRLDASLTLTDLRLAGVFSKGTFAEPWLALGFTGDLPSPSASARSLTGGHFTLQTGDPKAPTLDLAATADILLQPRWSIPSFVLDHLSIPNLPKAQKEFALFWPGRFDLLAGSLSAAGAWSYEDGRIQFTRPLTFAIEHLTLNQVRGDTPHRLLQDQPVTLTLADTVTIEPQWGVADLKIITDALTAHLTGGRFSFENQFAADGKLEITGDLDRICRVLETIQQKPAGTYAYTGQLKATQTLATGPAGLSLAGSAVIDNLHAPQVDEKELQITNDLLADPDAKNLTIRKLALGFNPKGALALEIQGKVLDWAGARRITGLQEDQPMQARVSYVLEQLWPMVHPLLIQSDGQDALKDLKIAGTFDKQLTISGSLPASADGRPLPFSQAVKSLRVAGGLEVGMIQTHGVDLENLLLPLDLREGKLYLRDAAHPDQPLAAAAFNGGKLNLNGIWIDLGQEHPRLNAPANLHLIADATLNPIFADSILGHFLNNPLFSGAENAGGLFDLTLVQADNFPVDSWMKNPASDGILSIRYSIRQLAIGNQFVTNLISLLAPNALNGNSVQGNIQDATVTIQHGVVTQETPLQVEKYTIPLSGRVEIATGRLAPMTIGIPIGWIKGIPDQLKAFAPDSIPIPLEGTIDQPQFKPERIIPKIIEESAKKAAVNAILPGGNRNNPNSTTQPAGANPLEQLQDLFGGEKNQQEKKNKKEKQKSGQRPSGHR